jgi:hypothetical protein
MRIPIGSCHRPEFTGCVGWAWGDRFAADKFWTSCKPRSALRRVELASRIGTTSAGSVIRCRFARNAPRTRLMNSLASDKLPTLCALPGLRQPPPRGILRNVSKLSQDALWQRVTRGPTSFRRKLADGGGARAFEFLRHSIAASDFWRFSTLPTGVDATQTRLELVRLPDSGGATLESVSACQPLLHYANAGSPAGVIPSSRRCDA